MALSVRSLHSYKAIASLWSGPSLRTSLSLFCTVLSLEGCSDYSSIDTWYRSIDIKDQYDPSTRQDAALSRQFCSGYLFRRPHPLVGSHPDAYPRRSSSTWHDCWPGMSRPASEVKSRPNHPSHPLLSTLNRGLRGASLPIPTDPISPTRSNLVRCPHRLSQHTH
jgi:hypothetical protein